MFIKLTNGTHETYTIGQLRRDNPQTSFPRDIPADVLAEFKVYKVKQTPAPEIDGKTHHHTQTVELVDGEWTQVWQVEQLPQDQAEANIRTYRDYLLQNSDWIVSKCYELGEPVPTDWATYRQALRDITLQEGFPYNVTWPTKG
jgi:hypothetical protein